MAPRLTLDVLKSTAGDLGLAVCRYAPGDGQARYRFFRDAPTSQTYYGPCDPIYTALGMAEAVHFLRGYQWGLSGRRRK